MENFVITVNRQFGAYGRKIAKRVGELLDIPVYDTTLAKEAAAELGIPLDEVFEIEENADPQPEHSINLFFSASKFSSNKQNQIFDVQKALIEELADKGNCIIVGRCSDYILFERPNVLFVYIYADHTARIKYCVEELGQTELEAQNTLRTIDERRNSYQLEYAGFLPDEKDYKDISICSNIFGVEETAQLIARAAKIKFGLE